MTLIDENPVIIETKTPVARILLNRPEHQNAVSPDFLRSLSQGLKRLRGLEGLRVVLFGSTVEGVFSVGLDVRSIMDLGSGGAEEFFDLAQNVVTDIREMSVPVVAVLEGDTIGAGLEIALACDIILATPEVRLGQAESNFGILPAMNGIFNIWRRSTSGVVSRLFYSGEIIDGVEGHRTGLIDMLCPREKIQEIAIKLAEEISLRAPLALTHAKALIRTYEREMQSKFQEEEKKVWEKVFSSKDREIGMQAFIQKAIPEFEGK
ncbi:MAG: enoyl-CoA hydratase/isomerase family protein [SAR324 cluster bacterium]|uniref:Enoyl-CoA hydratase/isomerase family protein n=1 Tax=SAR324 cluster bacterium TaxID=2024889 RepID=A0A7X9ILG6_9DELT|nr:enoyl-CoA hydratase/isomerase family protein [SAR324 cluster bacterium]